MTGQGPQPQPDEQAQADHATSSSSKTHKLSDEATSKILNQVTVLLLLLRYFIVLFFHSFHLSPKQFRSRNLENQ